MSNLLIQIIRTVVPMLAGVIFTWLITLGIVIPESIQSEFTSFIILLTSSLYYIGVSVLEKKIPAFGWLLGVARNPVYAAPNETVVVVPSSEV